MASFYKIVKQQRAAIYITSLCEIDSLLKKKKKIIIIEAEGDNKRLINKNLPECYREF
ncbi:polymerase [Coccidioides immitis RMSCC 2394]|uniref:Polymerase n=1 Tax=Coccidioides immitis RMSCC 2394 TaxID=404692 RepID=A0A0J6YKV6_COCIT|nr:polymerase [Coccidioides immitis RMSCC 2394]